jgi:glycerol-3-phosphate acyltransferase PlsX
VLLDVGANSDFRANDLVQFAFLGSAFSRAVLGVDRPRVGLLSVGEEPKKGSTGVVAAHAELAAVEGIGFVGNVEGRDLLAGEADVIVTDGFTGNVALKAIEGTARTFAGAIGDAARSNPVSALGGLLLRPALGGVRRRMDPDSTGGGILLGLRGVAIVGHGSSGPEGIANAVRLAARAVEQRAVERTAELLVRSGATRAALRDRKERR